MQVYEVNGWVKLSEEDKWEEGCIPDTGGFTCGEDRWTAPTIRTLVSQLMEFCSVTDMDDLVIFEDDPNQLHITVHENAYGSPLTDSQREEWKRGRVTAWDCIYSFRVTFVTRSLVDLRKELAGVVQID